MSNLNNPYTPNPYISEARPFDESRRELRLADLGKRFLGSLLDSLVTFGLMVPGLIVMIAGFASAELEMGSEPEFNATSISGIALMVLGFLALCGLQIYLLYTRSQSIGKYIVKTQIVDFRTGQRARFVNCFLLRSLVNGLIASIPWIGRIYSLVDICFVFRSDRRCIHDLIANTVVIDIS